MNKMFFICPMSKNVVDSILEIGSDKIGITVTRRQVDTNGGYVNNWDTESFFNYIRTKNDYGKRVLIQRDHGGPNQGLINDDGYESFINDSKYFHLIHIDPWKVAGSVEEGINKTIEYIKTLHSINPSLKFEVGTEQSIFELTPFDIERMIVSFTFELTEDEYNSIYYIVGQTGESLGLMNLENKGIFHINNLNEISNIAKKYNKFIKEHNGDFLTINDYKTRFDRGISSINIGPELSVLESKTYLNYMTQDQINEFYEICLESKKWERWVTGDVRDLSKERLIEICGHYNYTKYNLPHIDDIIQGRIKEKILSLITINE